MTDFCMSDRTRDELLADISLLPEANRRRLIDTLASLAAEIEIHCRRQVVETIRHDWSRNLETMLNRR